MPHYFANGFMVDETGTLQVGQPPIHHFNQGLPVDREGRLIVQLTQPESPGDAFVGGIRVGPLGGVYVVNLTPPPEVDAFSSGFNGGFQ